MRADLAKGFEDRDMVLDTVSVYAMLHGAFDFDARGVSDVKWQLPREPDKWHIPMGNYLPHRHRERAVLQHEGLVSTEMRVKAEAFGGGLVAASRVE